MIRILPILLAIGLPFAALAEPVVVRSGEHAGFSRLVIYLGATPDWSFGRVPGGYELRPTIKDAIYGLDDVFRLIPRDRIARIEQRSEGRLFLAVDCGCHAEAFKHLGQLVLDIKDGRVDSEEGFEANLPIFGQPDEIVAGFAGQKSKAIGSTYRPDAISDISVLPTLPLDFSPQRTDLAWGGDQLSLPLRDSMMMEIPPPMASPEAAARLAAAQADLVAQIARAASEGLVSPNIAVRTAHTPDPLTGGGTVMTEYHENPSSIANENLRNVHVETAFERGEMPRATNDGQTGDGDRCLPSSKFDLTAWGRPPDQGAAIADYRAHLVGEFDATIPDSIAALARHYIYLTFGAEARSLLESLGVEIEDAKLLIMLAEIMDNGHSDSFPEFREQLTCESAAAMWAIMAKPVLSKGDRVSVPTVLSTYAALPLHLRRHIGPGLAERFLMVGDTGSASTIRNAIVRAPGRHGEAVQMMEAEIALDLGHENAGVAQLEDVVGAGGPLAPEAVIRLIETQLASGTTPDASLVEAANALAFEARGTESGARLAQVSLRAMMHSGDIRGALDGLDRMAEPFNLVPPTVEGLRREAFEIVAVSGLDQEFLQAVFRGPLNMGVGRSVNDIRQRVAARLIDLGLFPAARDVLAEGLDVPQREDRMLYAKSFLGEERADLAMGYLAGLNDPAALELRADAHILAQEFDRAAELYASLGDDGEQSRAVWRGQMWDAVRSVGSETERAAAELMTTGSDVVATQPIGPMTLAIGESLVDESRRARQVIDELLKTTAMP